VLFIIYAANCIIILSGTIIEKSLTDYTDIDGKEIGTFLEYEPLLRNFGADISTFNHDELNEAIDMLKD